MTLIDLQKT